MRKEIKKGDIVEIYNKYLPFVSRKLEASSIGIVINVYDFGRYEVDVNGIEGHAGTSYSSIRSRWYVHSEAIKVT